MLHLICRPAPHSPLPPPSSHYHRRFSCRPPCARIRVNSSDQRDERSSLLGVFTSERNGNRQEQVLVTSVERNRRSFRTHLAVTKKRIGVTFIVYRVSKMKTKVLGLYKRLMRYGDTLQFTDKDYYRNRIRKDFQKNKDLSDSKAIKFYVEKGQKLLQDRRVA